jgi:hypothetical protein
MARAEVRGIVIEAVTVSPGRWWVGGFRCEGPLCGDGDVKRLDIRAMRARDPIGADDTRVLAARLFVGFGARAKPTRSLDDVLRIVREVRVQQSGDPDMAFLFTEGVCWSKPPSTTEEEPGAQIVIIDQHRRTQERFQAEIVALAETLASFVGKERIFVEMQIGGAAFKIMQVAP